MFCILGFLKTVPCKWVWSFLSENTHQILHQSLHFETSLQMYVYYNPASTMIAPGPYILNSPPMAANQIQPLATYYTYPGSVAKPIRYVVHGATNGASNGLTNPAYFLHQNSVAVASENQNHGQEWTAYQVSPS